MARSDKLPVARPYEDTWPKELAHLRAGLMRRATFHVFLTWIVGAVATLMLFMLVWLPWRVELRAALAGWFGPSGPLLAVVVCSGVLGVAISFASEHFLGRIRTRRYRNVLLAHGFCPCGYKYVEQGDSRSCPECGRQWTAKQPPRE